MRFFIADVFGEVKYSGNQLAVFFADASMPSEEMQKIAHEIHFSETTFVMSGEPGDHEYDVRIFTPGKEVDFAGHPTLGTAFVIREYIAQRAVDKLVLKVKAGSIPVSFSSGDVVWMDQIEPVFKDAADSNLLMQMLNLPLDALNPDFPIEQVSTGLPHFVIPIRNLDYLKKAKIDRDLYFNYVQQAWAKNILIFCPQGYTSSHDISVRMFADYLGIPEDPATGSGNGCLAGYLVRHRFFGAGEINIKAAQGYEISRPSTLWLRARNQAGTIHISVGGNVTMIAEGNWRK